MPFRLQIVTSFWHRSLRTRFAFPVALLFAAVVLGVSEQTYVTTTTTLRGGIELTDARVQTLQLLQLLTDGDAGVFAYLATGSDEYLATVKRAADEVPALRKSVLGFFAALDAEDAAASTREGELIDRRLARFARALELPTSNDPSSSAAFARDEAGRPETTLLRAELTARLARATGLQQKARVSIYDALKINHAAVAVLTLVALASLFFYLRQLQSQEADRRERQAALLRERAALEEEIRRRTVGLGELTKHLQTVREDERAHLARELHDELGGLLTASKLEIARARKKVDEPAQLLTRLDRIVEHLDNGIALKRRIIEDLRPSTLSSLGLTIALENLCREMSESLGAPVTLAACELRLTAEGELAIYRFVQEALTNIGKYANASVVKVALEATARAAVATVSDDGVGFDLQRSRAGHHGLSGMQFRAESLGGSMSIESLAGAGTTLRIELPRQP